MDNGEVEHRNATTLHARQAAEPLWRIRRPSQGFQPIGPACIVTVLTLVSLTSPAQACSPFSAPLRAIHAFALANDANQPADENQSEPNTTQPDDREHRMFDFARSVLLNPSDDIDQATRRNAATELLALGTSEALNVLGEALRSNHKSVVTAVAASIAENGRHEVLLDSLIEALRTADEETARVLGRAIQQYQAKGVTRVSELALNQDESVEQRLGAVHALGSLRNRDAARQLMNLLEREDEPDPITSAACTSLARLTGFTYGQDVERWAQWWQWAKDLPRDEWFKAMVQMLSRRLTELEKSLQQQQKRIEQADQRLLSVYRSLFPLAPLETQIRELPRLLNDETEVVRSFAVERVEVLLRDSHKIPEDVQKALANHLADPTPRIRQVAAQLLDELDYDQLTARLAERLDEEQNEDVLATYIQVLSVRAAAVAVEPLQRHLMHERLGPLAADALWHALAESGINGEKRQAVAKRAEQAMEKWRTPEHARLAAFVGDEDALKQLIPLLDQSDEELRRAVAQGLAQRGRAEPLLEHADDPVVYPHAVSAVCHGQADIAKFQALSKLQPPNGQIQTWRDAVAHLSAKLKPTELLQADDILAQCDWADLEFRIRTLARITNVEAEKIDATDRIDLFARLAELYLNHRDFGPAHQLLETLPKNESTASIAALRFRAAALAQAYDVAMTYHKEPAPWIALLQRTADDMPNVAATLRDEIARRFKDQLNGELGEQFSNVSARLAEANSNRDGGSPAPDDDSGQDSEDGEESGA